LSEDKKHNTPKSTFSKILPNCMCHGRTTRHGITSKNQQASSSK